MSEATEVNRVLVFKSNDAKKTKSEEQTRKFYHKIQT